MVPAPKDFHKKEDWKRKLSISHKGKIPWNRGLEMPPEFRVKMGNLSRQFWLNPQNKEKIKIRNAKIAESKRGDKNPMKRPEVRVKHSQRMMGKLVGNKNPSKKPEVRNKISLALRGHGFSVESKKKISGTLKGKLVGELNPFFGKHHSKEVRERSRIRAIKQIASGLLRNRRTMIELKILEELENRNIKFLEQYPLANVTVADFYLPHYHTVIYCDGDYWHKGKWAMKNGVIEKDQKQNTKLETLGYKVFRFDEEKINRSPADCINEVENYIYRKSAKL